ncbi:IMPACT family protein [Pyramidobacter piscolens]|uniref:IMPACT family protein n=1 Tax=Pyramidobacter piscolens TaxID=638849 RepID=UPI003AB15F17
MLALNQPCRRPAAPAVYSFKEKRSEFIAAHFPAAAGDEARAALESVRKEHYGAAHNCPAWRVGYPDVEEFCSDDGEPGGTAGRPILGVLQKAGLFNAVLVVTRYFGGVKLGVRGLIDAYGAAAAGVIERAALETALPFKDLELCCSYEHLASLSRVVKNAGVAENRLRTTYAADVTLNLLVSPEIEERLRVLLDSYEGRTLLAAPPRWGKDYVLAAEKQADGS